MSKRQKKSQSYVLHLAIIHKLTQSQIFWLCVLALLVIGIIGVCAPSSLLSLL